MNYSRNGGLLFQKEVHNAYLWALRIGKLRHFEVYRTAIISKVLSAFRQVMTNVPQEQQPHRAPNSTPAGGKATKSRPFSIENGRLFFISPLVFSASPPLLFRYGHPQSGLSLFSARSAQGRKRKAPLTDERRWSTTWTRERFSVSRETICMYSLCPRATIRRRGRHGGASRRRRRQ